MLLTGCSIADYRVPNNGSDRIEEQHSTVSDLATVSKAIKVSDDRIVDVRDIKSTMSGFSYGIQAIVDVDSSEPLSSDSLLRVLEAIWDSRETKPVDIGLVAVVYGTESDGVDLRAAATDLVGADGWNKHGNKGVVILSGSLKELMLQK